MLSSKKIPEKERSAILNRLSGLLDVTEDGKKTGLMAVLDDWHSKVHQYSDMEMDEESEDMEMDMTMEDTGEMVGGGAGGYGKKKMSAKDKIKKFLE